jgi:hypothetical protein
VDSIVCLMLFRSTTMFFSIAALAALLFGFSNVVAGDAGGTMDPNGLHTRAVATSDQGTATDPDGRTRASAFAGCGMDPDGCRRTAAATASADQGMGTDPDGLRAR